MTPAAVTAWREGLAGQPKKREAALSIGVTPQTLANWEAGRTEPGLTERLAMAAAARGLEPWRDDYCRPAPDASS